MGIDLISPEVQGIMWFSLIPKTIALMLLRRGFQVKSNMNMSRQSLQIGSEIMGLKNIIVK